LIISAQSVQEFWNSQLVAVETIASALEKRFTDLEREVKKVDGDFGDYRQRFSELLNGFQAEYGHLLDKNARRNVGLLIEMLSKRARVIEVPRHRFQQYAEYRQRTRTPPGFKDQGDGDFYVWLDFLYGLNALKLDGFNFRKAVMVTDDRKVDWSRGGVAHPTLTAEVSAYVSVPFEAWTLNRLADSIETLPV
jgi:hypothetical protein